MFTTVVKGPLGLIYQPLLQSQQHVPFSHSLCRAARHILQAGNSLRDSDSSAVAIVVCYSFATSPVVEHREHGTMSVNERYLPAPLQTGQTVLSLVDGFIFFKEIL